MGVSPELMQRVRARVGVVLNGKWRLDRVLGIGGMAAVYAATHRNQKRVAIKMLHTHLAFDDNVKGRFLREGYAANSVNHPGAVTVYDDDVADDGAAFIVMELLEGETLDARAERKGLVLPVGEVLALIDQLLDVLVAAHDSGLIHRDLKPENLFLTVDGQLKVLDFGIARLHEASTTNHSTAVGSFMGTPAYMAPEQARGRWDEVDVRSDIWAVGATLYTLLTGRNVHEADTVNDQLVFAATQPAPSIGEFLPELPASIVHLTDKALMYSKRDRWPDARSMQAALRACLPDLGNVDLPSAPRISVVRSAADLDADTLAAPPGVLSEISSDTHSYPGGRNVTNATAAVTSSRQPSLPPSGRARAVKVSLAVAVALGIGLVVVVGTHLAGDEPARVDAPLQQPDEPATAVPASGSPETPVVEPAMDAALAEEVEDAGEVADEAPDPPVAKPAPAPRPVAKPRPTARPAPKPAPSPAPAPAPSPTSNPFDRRF